MPKSNGPAFEFKNQVSPRYIEALFLPLADGEWRSTETLVALLQAEFGIDGDITAKYNLATWSYMGIGEYTRDHGSKSFRLNALGIWLAHMYSTNQPLFFDLMHYLFYSTWLRSGDIWRARFWLYQHVCELLWNEAPHAMDTFHLTGKTQKDAANEPAFIQHHPAFPDRSVGSVYTWLQKLSPPFLTKTGTRGQLTSQRRDRCTPQLFHLAVDLVYHTLEQCLYGISLGLGDEQIAAICRICLLQPESFWEMLELTEMSFPGIEVKHGQWGTTLILSGPPQWIMLPSFHLTDAIQGDQPRYDEEDEE